jgi:hypothetical protein
MGAFPGTVKSDSTAAGPDKSNKWIRAESDIKTEATPTPASALAFKFDGPHQTLRSAFEEFASEAGTRGSSNGYTSQAHPSADTA